MRHCIDIMAVFGGDIFDVLDWNSCKPSASWNGLSQ